MQRRMTWFSSSPPSASRRLASQSATGATSPSEILTNTANQSKTAKSCGHVLGPLMACSLDLLTSTGYFNRRMIAGTSSSTRPSTSRPGSIWLTRKRNTSKKSLQAGSLRSFSCEMLFGKPRAVSTSRMFWVHCIMYALLPTGLGSRLERALGLAPPRTLSLPAPARPGTLRGDCEVMSSEATLEAPGDWPRALRVMRVGSPKEGRSLDLGVLCILPESE
mmetsp:Transcript_1643/g.3597  ORF Transcript_1643/g.3597 Transcript_1643/m.3597 type:complete len:220 (-) Transcript_1643:24-683(-)